MKSSSEYNKGAAGMTMFSFLTPFSSSMWLSIAIAYVMVSLMMFFIGRMSPYERYSNQAYQTCSEGNRRLINRTKNYISLIYFLAVILLSKLNIIHVFSSFRKCKGYRRGACKWNYKPHWK